MVKAGLKDSATGIFILIIIINTVQSSSSSFKLHNISRKQSLLPNFNPDNHQHADAWHQGDHQGRGAPGTWSVRSPSSRSRGSRSSSSSSSGYPRYTSQVHAQFQQIINSMNQDIGVTVETSNALFTQVATLTKYLISGFSHKAGFYWKLFEICLKYLHKIVIFIIYSYHDVPDRFSHRASLYRRPATPLWQWGGAEGGDTI